MLKGRTVWASSRCAADLSGQALDNHCPALHSKLLAKDAICVAAGA